LYRQVCLHEDRIEHFSVCKSVTWIKLS
jgi:hypothetical protein